MNYLKLLISILISQVGAEEGQSESGDAGQATPPADEGQGGTPGDEANADQDGSGSAAPATPKYGEFGDNPTIDQIYERHQKAMQEFNSLKGKTTATERNLAALRKTIEGSGMRVVQDQSGNIQIVPTSAEKKEGQQKGKFTDTHKALFDAPVLDAINLLIGDALENRFGEYDQKTQQQRQFVNVQATSNKRMLELYPQLNQTGKSFDENFFNRATEIWEESYRGNPRGELVAAHEAAIELGINPVSLANAEKKGYEKGVASKTILSPVGGSSQSKAGGVGKRLSRDDYLKLPDEEKEKYDKETMKV